MGHFSYEKYVLEKSLQKGLHGANFGESETWLHPVIWCFAMEHILKYSGRVWNSELGI